MVDRQLKKNAVFDEQLRSAIPNARHRAEADRGIKFMLSHIPEQGTKTRVSSPVPVYAWPFLEIPHCPALIVYYTYSPTVVLLLSVKVTRDVDED